MSRWEMYLESIYYDVKHPGSYAGPSKLYQAVKAEAKFKIPLTRIKSWLKGQETYTMTHQVRRKFPSNTYVVEGLDSHWQSDLMDMVSLAKYNDGVRYLMVIIDLFSRYLWVLPLKSKTGNDSGSGSEYKNHKVKAFLKSHGITQLFALNETKASYAERVIKTIKMRLYRYMLNNCTYKYTDVLEKVIYSYSHTKHRMLGQTPTSVNQTNEGEIRLSQYLIKPKKAIHKKKFIFNIGDKVRVSHLRGTFDREYQEKWSGEIFTIEKRYWSQGKDLYKLKDWGGDVIEGTFYAAELQKVTENPDQLYRIQDIVKRRTRNKQKEVLVKWLHWPKKYNSWIQEADVVRYQTV
ncbi:uncharacterized protein LOC121385896 [Gigantopelta aegis]|uniref:uncharacterized protein LOC121385896 n=1 Tax=Gigantopelta aegis TaxID=1735272 RepID=UPI001B88BFAE|nr:uncharacterized protein LOC121385896 [Gigantopelta aegis]